MISFRRDSPCQSKQKCLTSKLRCTKCKVKLLNFGGTFDISAKEKRIEELKNASQNPNVWNDHSEMQKINQEMAIHQKVVEQWQSLHQKVEDSLVLAEMLLEEPDENEFLVLKEDLVKNEKFIEQLEVQSFLSGELDPNSCYLSINSGAGGTEACDWAGMIYRMYVRYAEQQGFKVEVLSMADGDEAGIKSATLSIQGPYAYGFLKAENGVHRLVRISPFDSNAKRHTSFASVFCWAEVNDDIDIEVKDEDIKVDTYRASGAGGQHINTTDSAVRITHIPSGVIVQCQNQRSQHANRDTAMKMLKAALYEKEVERRNKEKDSIESGKMANEWGSQIRSYVLHPYQMVKDHRTNFETSKTGAVLDGGLDPFIETFLKSQVTKSEGQ